MVGPCLVIDDTPGVGDDVVIVPGKSMVAGPGRFKAVAHNLYLLLLPLLQQLLSNVICCQRCQSPTQRMPCKSYILFLLLLSRRAVSHLGFVMTIQFPDHLL